MRGFHVLAALFGVYMLVRHAPRAAEVLRGRRGGALGIVSILNVLLAVAILAVAAKGIAGALISR
jgi:hypothetical protein